MLPTAVVGQPQAQAIQILHVVGGGRCGRGAGHVVEVAVHVVLVVTQIEVDVLVVRHQPLQAGQHVDHFTLLQGIGVRVVGLIALPVVALITFHHHAAQQLVVDEGAGNIGAGLVGIAAITLGGHAVGVADGGFRFLLGLAQDHVDHAPQGIGPVQGGDGAADHLDALDGGHGNGAQVEVVAVGAAQGLAGVDPFAVDQQQGVVTPHAADLDLVAAGRVGGDDVDARHVLEGIADVVDVHLVQIGTGHHRDAGRGGQLGVLGLGGGDHHGLVGLDRLCLGQARYGQQAEGEQNRVQTKYAMLQLHCQNSMNKQRLWGRARWAQMLTDFLVWQYQRQDYCYLLCSSVPG